MSRGGGAGGAGGSQEEKWMVKCEMKSSILFGMAACVRRRAAVVNELAGHVQVC